MDQQQLIVGFHSVHTQLPILSGTKHNLSKTILKMVSDRNRNKNYFSKIKKY